MNKCKLCGNDVDKNNPKTWKQVTGFVGGPKKDSMRLREDTGNFAHDECVKKVSEGQAVDQPSMFDDEPDCGCPHTKIAGCDHDSKPVDLPEELQP